MAGFSRKTSSSRPGSVLAISRASSPPSRCFSLSGPEKAVCTGTCWSSAKPTSSANGSCARSASASVFPVKWRASGFASTATTVILEGLGEPLRNRGRRQVRVRTRDRRDDRRVDDDQVLVAVHAAALIDHRADSARSRRMEESACGRAHVGDGVDLLTGPALACGVPAYVTGAAELPQLFEALGQDLLIGRVRQKAVVDRQRRARI